jgi:hypothetical protein
MGYTTDFKGSFKLNKRLKFEDHEFLNKFAETRRMKRRLPAKYGVEGEFYVEGTGEFGQDSDKSVLDYNEPPCTQPGLWCQWVPTKDGKGIEWDGNEKFYNYVEWITYLIDKILKPRGYVLNGEVYWQGEDSGDVGCIVIRKNKVATKKVKLTWED